MSVIKILNHDECIYDWKVHHQKFVSKPALYTSKFNEEVKSDLQKTKGTKANFGYAESPHPKPSEFLKKNARLERPKAEAAKHQCVFDIRKPPLPPLPGPRKDEKQEPITNFVKKNIINVKRQVPTQRPAKAVMSVTGETVLLEPSGLVPTYRNTEAYGKIPSYIHEFQKERDEMVRNAREIKDRKANEGAFYIPMDERNQIVDGMKQNWAELMRNYQRLPIITDTTRKIQNKIKLENQLVQLETDIAMMESHPIIYVSGDERIFI